MRVLVVEDEPEFANLIAEALTGGGTSEWVELDPSGCPGCWSR